ncbi:MAG: outer membrane lipoprotein-sorting protein [Proteobacteria bacterium]|nr:outer membrane lipoprotein-sorting protein [Pseudomonadota bacterium]
MKKIKITGLFTICSCLLFLFSQTALALTGKEIIDQTKKMIEPDAATSTVIMLIYKGDKALEKEFEIMSKKDGDDNTKTLISFTKPTKIKLLTHMNKGKESDQWLRLSSGKIKRITSSGKDKSFVNSHFTYEDLSSRNNDDYTYELIGSETINGDDCYKVQAEKKGNNRIYDKSITYVRKTDYVILRDDLFQKGALLKYIENSDIREIDGIKTPFKIVMIMADGSGKTELNVQTVQYNVELKDNLFNKDALR